MPSYITEDTCILPRLVSEDGFLRYIMKRPVVSGVGEDWASFILGRGVSNWYVDIGQQQILET
jgi:hypothetical protein